MTTPAALTPADLNAAISPAPKARVDLSSELIARWKHTFMQVARTLCPAFTVTDDNRHVIAEIFHWAMRTRQGSLDPDLGLLLWGSIGTGKSTLLDITGQFARLCRPRDARGFPYAFRTTSTIDVAEAFNSSGYDGIASFCNAPHQAFDDLGTEPLHVNYYGTRVNVMEHIILARYVRRSDDFTHITTNISPEDISDFYTPRVFDRCREMFNFLELGGRSLRAAARAQQG